MVTAGRLERDPWSIARSYSECVDGKRVSRTSEGRMSGG
jgi:hypothetical protein